MLFTDMLHNHYAVVGLKSPSPQENDLPTLGLSFLICEMRISNLQGH